MGPELSLILSYLKFPLRDNIPIILYLGMLKGDRPSSVPALS
jgi:hypothetical protein